MSMGARPKEPLPGAQLDVAREQDVELELGLEKHPPRDERLVVAIPSGDGGLVERRWLAPIRT